MQEPLTAIMLIQQALTPVFLIVGMGTFLNAITSRLARIVDRVRWFDLPEAENSQYKREPEIKALSRRMRWANWSVNFLCAAAIAVCINIFLLVIQGYFSSHLTNWIVGSFVSSLVLLALGLFCFFVEVSIATTSLRVSIPSIRDED